MHYYDYYRAQALSEVAARNMDKTPAQVVWFVDTVFNLAETTALEREQARQQKREQEHEQEHEQEQAARLVEG